MKKAILLIISVMFLAGCQQTQLTSQATPTSNKPKQQILKISTFEQIQGKWISNDDISSTIEFKDKQVAYYYDDKLINTETFNIYTTSTPNQQYIDKHGSYLITKGEFDINQYVIKRNDGTNLELQFWPRGNMLKYSRTLPTP